MKEFKFGRGIKKPSNLLGGEAFHRLAEFAVSGSTTMHFTNLSGGVNRNPFRPNIINRESFGDFTEHFERICEYVGDSIQRNTETQLHTQHGTFSILSMTFTNVGLESTTPQYRVEVRHWPNGWVNKWLNVTLTVTNDAFLSDMIFSIESFNTEHENLPF